MDKGQADEAYWQAQLEQYKQKHPNDYKTLIERLSGKTAILIWGK